MRKYAISTTLSLGVLFQINAQEQPFPLVWYNVENLFDTIDQPGVADEEFTPDSEKEWVSWKYWTKLNRLSKVIRNASGVTPPAIVALCEIENAQVLDHLSRRPALEKSGYNIIHYDSPDARGIDVGLLYDPQRIRMFASRQIPVDFPWDTTYKTRDILQASGVLTNGDTLHVLVNHWPSRRGGAAASEPRRMRAAEMARRAVDSIRSINPRSLIVLTGDFNDHPHNRSIREGLGTGENSAKLINLSEGMPPGTGTHRYRGEWGYLDQWIISQSFETHSHWKTDTAFVYRNEELLEEDTRYPGYHPKRSWRGPFFTSGYSDHLPIVLILSEK